MLDDPLVIALVLAVAGFIAAIINAMVGGGSLLTLPLLVAVGLPATVANGTNRIGVLLQGLSSVVTFHERGARPYGAFARLIGPMALGAAAGAYGATQISDELLRPIFGGLLVAWAVILTVKPRTFDDPVGEPGAPGLRGQLGAAAIGVYGGFIQAGVGFPLLALLVVGLRHRPVQANAIKVLLVLVYTLAILPIFVWQDQVAWLPGLALGVGSAVGGFVGVRWQVKSGAKVVRVFVTVTVLVSGLALILAS